MYLRFSGHHLFAHHRLSPNRYIVQDVASSGDLPEGCITALHPRCLNFMRMLSQVSRTGKPTGTTRGLARGYLCRMPKREVSEHTWTGGRDTLCMHDPSDFQFTASCSMCPGQPLTLTLPLSRMQTCARTVQGDGSQQQSALLFVCHVQWVSVIVTLWYGR